MACVAALCAAARVYPVGVGVGQIGRSQQRSYPLNIILPDGSSLSVDAGATTLDAAAKIGPRLHQ